MTQGKRENDPFLRALAEWPDARRSALDWDEAAERVEARIAAGAKPRSSMQLSDEELLRPPLPQTRVEEESMSRGPASDTGLSRPPGDRRSRDRDRQSLKDLAKLATSGGAQGSVPPPSADGSGVISIPVLTEGMALPPQPPQPSSRPSVPAPPSRPKPVLPPELRPIIESPRVAPASRPAVQAALAAPPEKKKGGGAAWAVFGVLAAAAAVGGVYLGMKGQGRGFFASSAPASSAPAPVVSASAAAPPVMAAQANAVPSSASSAVASASASVVPATALAMADPKAAGGKTTTSGGPPPSKGPSGRPTVLNASNDSLNSRSDSTPQPAPAPQPAPQAKPAGTDLNSLMQAAVGVTATAAPQLAPANNDSAPQSQGNVPLKPSLGAIQGALGAAVPGARSCLSSDDAVSRAMVTFKSDGSVQSVSVTGGAKGTPAEACIRSALMKAHVPPFAQPTFASPVTIRPN
jgi:hypothetical protein